MFYIQEQRKSKTHKIIFFGELENALPTYTTAASTLVRHEIFHSEISCRVCVGGKFVLTKRFSLSWWSVRGSTQRRYVNYDHALWRNLAEKQPSECFTIQKFFWARNNGWNNENCSMKQVHVAIDHELRQSISALITSGLVSTHAPFNLLPPPSSRALLLIDYF